MAEVVTKNFNTITARAQVRKLPRSWGFDSALIEANFNELKHDAQELQAKWNNILFNTLGSLPQGITDQLKKAF